MDLHFIPSELWDDEYKLLRTRPDIPIESDGARLERVGKLLMLWGLTEPDAIYPKVVDGLAATLIQQILPRTVYYGEQEPAESEPNRWFKSNGVWYRIDVSDSQLWYIIAGLRVLYDKTQYEPARTLYETLAFHVANHDFKIKFEGKVTPEGDFVRWWLPLGNQLLKALAISELTGKSLGAHKGRVMFNLNWLWAWSAIGRALGLLNNSDANNTSFILWFLKYLNKDKYAKHSKAWEENQSKVMEELKEKYQNNGEHNISDMVSDDVNYLNRRLFRIN